MLNICDIVYFFKNGLFCFENINDCIIKFFEGRGYIFLNV